MERRLVRSSRPAYTGRSYSGSSRQRRRDEDASDGLMSMLTLQTVICVAALVVCYGLRMAGGTLYEGARTSFHEMLAQTTDSQEVSGFLDGLGGRLGEAKTVILSLFGIQKDDGEATSGEEDAAEDDQSGLAIQQDGAEGDDELSELSVRTLLKITDATTAPRQSGGAGLTVSETSFISAAPRLLVPLHGEITSGFGYRIHPITEKLDYHTGVDIAAASGTPIIASAEGVVEERGTSDIYGRYLLIRHTNDVYTFYGHLSRFKVAQGARVREGDVIGLVGNTGQSTGPHLHFEIRLDGSAVDPETILKF